MCLEHRRTDAVHIQLTLAEILDFCEVGLFFVPSLDEEVTGLIELALQPGTGLLACLSRLVATSQHYRKGGGSIFPGLQVNLRRQRHIARLRDVAAGQRFAFREQRIGVRGTDVADTKKFWRGFAPNGYRDLLTARKQHGYPFIGAGPRMIVGSLVANVRIDREKEPQVFAFSRCECHP